MTSKSGQYAEVVINIPVNRKFHYSIPENLKNQVVVGKMVKVPFGNRLTTGYCVGFTDKPDVEKIKDIKDVIDESPSIDEGMLKISKWISGYYCCSWGEALEAVLPGSVKKGIKEKTVKLASLSIENKDIQNEINNITKKSPAQAKILEALSKHGSEIEVKELLNISNANQATLSRLEKRGLIKLKLVSVDPLEYSSNDILTNEVPAPTLTDEQEMAVKVIREKFEEGKFGVVLLHGVTGSGKTEVYLQAIEIAISLGLCSIVLVPEISLTPQTVKYFKTRFSKVAIMHSNLTESDRKKQWKMIKDGVVNVVVGTRSAVFAPVKKLGVIIVDEEHENTFKQENTPRYHARDVGIMRAMYNNALVILGSATPSLESYYNAITGKYVHVFMHKKVAKMVLPTVEIVDMEEESRRTKGYCYLSRRLEDCMRQTLSENGQIILFLNRRGFAPFVNCKRCGFVLKCKRCDIALTYHKKNNKMVCHYCSNGQSPPKDCPECAMPNIKYQGFGTERIEEEIKRKFPEQCVLRMDSDTMRGKGSHENALSDFHDCKVNILLGTQMIAKGLDFPNVTLVGVISADTSLNIPDFRSSEKTFQLLTQVSGRTGRGHKGGRVIIQSFNTKHYSIRYASNADYEGFAKEELEFRKQLNYPPYGRIIRLLFVGKQEEKVKERAAELTNKLRQCSVKKGNTVEVLGPVPASINKIKDKFRWHTILKAPKNSLLHSIIDDLNHDLSTSRGTQVIIDVDPGNML
ncbi:MAG: replication restart helicase PriA [Candidatus Anammoxibacter sp.]